MESIIDGATNASSQLSSITTHPFYPLEVEIAAYLANEMTMPMLLSIFVAIILTVVGLTKFWVDKVHPNLPGREKAAIWWFVISGAIHLFFEGYFSLNHKTMAPAQDLFGQLWKEYALSDSRYLTSDPFVLCMETVTAFTWGPICFVIAYMITTSHPLRHPLQIIVCVGQMYGLILYYATAMFDHYYNAADYSRPEFLYFWVYFFAVNFIWMIIPGLLLVSSVRTVARTFAALDKMTKTLANGKTKGAKKNL
ncbi:EBDP2, emopamil-binding protein [Marssonina coronariae]|uniref:EBDP2, emopamil-binding protein n=1 Tax=Diplocarpon coronariae TaxID=2795749 RepID=A0A218ZGQ0_9HELO|nr:EBDP2, emopamil-binding protein [Marssonina coronariae]